MNGAFSHIPWWLNFAKLLGTVGLLSLLIVGIFVPLRQAPPELIMPCCPLDLGSGSPGQEVSNSFPIRNGGVADLHYQITVDDETARVEPHAGTLASGEIHNIKVTIKLPSNVTANKRYELLVTSNAVEKSVKHVMRAKCLTGLQTSPAHVDFGIHSRGYVGSHNIAILDSAKNILRAEQIELLNPPSDLLVQPPLQELQSHDDETISKQWRIETFPNLDLGMYRWNLQFRHRETGENGVLSVLLMIADRLRVVPRRVTIPASRGVKTFFVLLVWDVEQKQLLGPLNQTRLPPGVTVVELSGEKPVLRRKIRLEFLPTFDPVANPQVKLEFANCEFETSLDVLCEEAQ